MLESVIALLLLLTVTPILIALIAQALIFFDEAVKHVFIDIDRLRRFIFSKKRMNTKPKE
jgi:hypothetical protein